MASQTICLEKISQGVAEGTGKSARVGRSERLSRVALKILRVGGRYVRYLSLVRRSFIYSLSEVLQEIGPEVMGRLDFSATEVRAV